MSYIKNITPPSSDVSWQKFCSDISKLQVVGYGNFLLGCNEVQIQSAYNKVLSIKKNSCEIICDIEWRDSYFLRTIAAVFMLYDKTCRGKSSWDVKFGGSWEDVQHGVRHLRNINAFDEEYTYCLQYTEQIQSSLDELTTHVFNDLHVFISGVVGRLYKSDFSKTVLSSIEKHCPHNIPLDEAIRLIGKRDILKNWRLYHVSVDSISYWFIDKKRAMEFLSTILPNVSAIKAPYETIVDGKKIVVEYMTSRHLQNKA